MSGTDKFKRTQNFNEETKNQNRSLSDGSGRKS